MISSEYGLGTWSQPVNFPKHTGPSPNNDAYHARLLLRNYPASKHPTETLIWKLFLWIDWLRLPIGVSGLQSRLPQIRRESQPKVGEPFPPCWMKVNLESLVYFMDKWSWGHWVYSPWSRIYFTISPLPVLAAWWRSEQWSGPWISRLPPFL